MWYYKHSKPQREVKGGIKARSKRGEFGQSWWAKRWMDVLHDFKLGARIDRGKSYARQGRVLSLEIQSGLVVAEVQGSERKPYHVEIKIETLSMSKWKKLAQEISTRPVLAAKLLAGQMPDNITSIFEDIGIPLFPNKKADLHTDCNCWDWSNPCKHIAAVYLLLAEEFDRDPFLIFKLRGVERNEILNMAGLRSIAGTESTQSDSSLELKPDLPPEPLPTEPDEFWSYMTSIKDPELVEIPATPASLPKQLGNFPFWRGNENFLDSMAKIYSFVSFALLHDDEDWDTKCMRSGLF